MFAEQVEMIDVALAPVILTADIDAREAARPGTRR
jgi:hypothetical protein